jgi:hypothetical protein
VKEDTGELLTVGQVAQRYGVSRSAVHLWIQDGLPVAAALRGAESGRVIVYLFRPADVDAYVRARKASGRWGTGKRGPGKKVRVRD